MFCFFLGPRHDGVQQEGTGLSKAIAVRATFDCSDTAVEDLRLSVSTISCLSDAVSISKSHLSVSWTGSMDYNRLDFHVSHFYNSHLNIFHGLPSPDLSASKTCLDGLISQQPFSCPSLYFKFHVTSFTTSPSFWITIGAEVNPSCLGLHPGQADSSSLAHLLTNNHSQSFLQPIQSFHFASRAMIWEDQTHGHLAVRPQRLLLLCPVAPKLYQTHFFELLFCSEKWRKACLHSTATCTFRKVSISIILLMKG